MDCEQTCAVGVFFVVGLSSWNRKKSDILIECNEYYNES